MMVAILVKELPQSIQTMLNVVGYGRADIEVNVCETISPAGAGGDGYRSIFASTVISDSAVEPKVTMGSWGGSNIFVQTIADDVRESFLIPLGTVVFKGTGGGSKPVSGQLWMNAGNVAPILPPIVELSEVEKQVLYTYKGLTSAGRKRAHEELGYMGVKVAPIVAALTAKGFIAKKGNGVGITVEGKNALGNFRWEC